MTAHRYWRIFMTKNAGDGSFSQFAEVEMRTAAGGADQCNSGTAACSGSLQSGSAAGIFANDGVTSWAQWGGTGGFWCSYDFGVGVTKDIIEVAIMGATGGASRALGAGFVQWSDDNATWTTAWTISYLSGYTSGTFVVFSKPAVAGAYRYWRTRFDSSLSNAYSIAKMTMATALAGADQCSGGTAMCFENFGSQTPSLAFDGNIATYYGSTVSSNYEFLGYDFGSGVTKSIVEISLTPRQDGNFKQWPSALTVEASPDGVNWLSQWSVAKSIVTYSDGAWVFRNPASVTSGSTHRWWGIHVATVQSAAVFGVREIEFRATAGGADLTTGGVGGASSPFDGGTLPSYAFDSTTAEYASLIITELVAYDYGNGNEKGVPLQIAVTARGAGLQTQAPTAFDLVYSDDGINWTVQQSYTSPATWAAAEQRLFGVTAPASRRRAMICS